MDLIRTFVFLLSAINACQMALMYEEGELLASQKKAQYHLQELQRSMTQISSIQKRLIRRKRDLEGAPSNQKADFLFNSLITFCSQIQDFNTNNTDSTVKKSKEEKKEINWMVPAVRPTRVQAMRIDNNTVGIQFYVNESTPFIITRIAGFDIETLEVPKGHGSRDHGGFRIDTSSYCEDEDNEIDNQFVFESRDNTNDTIQLRVNVCKFDKFQDQSVPWEDRKWEMRYGPRREDIELPKMGVDPNIPNEIVLVPGKNITFEMTVQMDYRSHVFLYAVFYDRVAKKIISNSISYDHRQEQFSTPVEGSNERKLITIDFLESSIVQNATEYDEPNRNSVEIKQIKSRVTLIIESEQLTGKLFLTASDRFGEYYDPAVVSSAFTGHAIKIRKSNRKHVFPRHKVLFQTSNESFCDLEGNKRFERNGRNCTMTCGALGRDLVSLTISKKDVVIPIYRSVTQKWTDRLFTMIDVGPASPDVEGTYVCTVTGANGKLKESREIHLYTSGSPKIDTNETTIEDLGNGMSLIKCVVYGVFPIDISVKMTVGSSIISLSSTRLEDMGNGTGTVFTQEIPTAELLYPSISLRFEVQSRLGIDDQTIYLDEFIPDHRGDAKMVPEDSMIVNFGNGTTAITCTASGREPLTIWIAIGGTQESYRIDNEVQYTRVETQTEKGKSVTLFANTRSLIRNYSWLYCGARNEYGLDNTEYYLRDYIDWDLKYQRR